jgi:hypothetical protein
MDHLNASYYLRSIQDPSFHHTNLHFSCEIFDNANTLLHKADFSVNNLGFLNVILDREYLISLEEQTMVIKNHVTTLIEPITIETEMGSIVNRTDFLLYYKNLTQINNEAGVSVAVNLEAGTFLYGLDTIAPPLYFEWMVSNVTRNPLQNGSGSVGLRKPISIFLDPRFTPVIEELTIDLWFEGNFIFKSKQISLHLRDQVLREVLDLSLTNYAALMNCGMGDLCFQLREMHTGNPVPYHPVKIVTMIESVEEPLSTLICTTDENGSTKLSLSEGAIRDLEHVLIKIQAFANLTFKELIQTFRIGEIFTRLRPSLRFNNVTDGLTLYTGLKNEISMSVLFNGDIAYLSGRRARLLFFDEQNAALFELNTPVRNDGLVVCDLPVHLLRAGQTIRVSVTIGATLVSQELSANVWYHVVAVIDSASNTAVLVLTSSICIVAAIFGLIITITCVKKARYNFLSKDQFSIKLA